MVALACGKQHRGREQVEALCSPIAALLDAHAASAQARGRTSILVHVERPFKPGGVGDQFAGLLGSIALAVATGRRLELAPQSTSYLRLGFNFPFDTDYTGAQSWLSQITPQPDSSLGDPTLPFDHCIDLDSQADNISAVSAAIIVRRKGRCAPTRLICNYPSLEVLLSPTRGLPHGAVTASTVSLNDDICHILYSPAGGIPNRLRSLCTYAQKVVPLHERTAVYSTHSCAHAHSSL